MHKLYCEKEELSLGQLFLLDICDKRQITNFWSTKLNCEADISYLMKVATGAYKYPNLKILTLLLGYVSPSMWFYTEEEYKKKFKTPNQNQKKNFISDWHESKNFKALLKMYEENKLYKYYSEKYSKETFKNKYITVYHIITGRNNLSTRLMKELESDFPLDDWFRK